MITPSYSATATERVLPRMALDFTTGVLDPRVTVTRASNTATRVNSSGLVEIVNANLPRFDYDPATLAPKGLLIEEVRTNALLRSEEFNDVVWSKGNGTVTANAVLSPDGTTDADSFVTTAATAGTFVQQAFVSLAQAYAASFYVKPNGVQFVQLLWAGGQSTNIANFDIINGTIGTNTATSASITAAGNGWYRITIVSTLAAAAGAINVYCVPTSTSGRAASFTGNGTSGFYIWGAQLEAGAFATSYIPTVASQVTRNPDLVSMTGTNFSDWYNASEGTFVASGYSVYSVAGANPLIYASDGTENNYLRLLANNVSSSTVNVSAVAQANFSFGSPTVNSAINDYVLAYKLNSFCAAYNSSTGTDVSGTLPVVDRLQIGQRASGTLMSGTIKRIYYYNIRLTNNECLTLSQRSIRGA
jgi:hypothetical protein